MSSKEEDSSRTVALKKHWETRTKKWTEEKLEANLEYKIIKNKLEKRISHVTNALEIGCGNGRWLRLLSNNGIDVYGIDIVKRLVLELNRESFKVLVADARRLPFRNDSFDLTFSFGVVEHFEGTETAIYEHIRVTKPGGRIVITVPYLYSPFNIMWIVHHLRRGTFSERPHSYGKRYAKNQLRKILEPYNIHDLSIDTYLFVPLFRRFFKNIDFEKTSLRGLGYMLWVEMVKSE